MNRSTTANAYLIGLVNYQKELPNVPARDVSVTLSAGRAPTAVRAVSGGPLDWTCANGQLTLTISELETIEMIEIDE